VKKSVVVTNSNFVVTLTIESRPLNRAAFFMSAFGDEKWLPRAASKA